MKQAVVWLADHLNNRQYREEVDRKIEHFARWNDLVIVFGASDDLVEFRGAFDEEFSYNNSFKVYRGKYRNLVVQGNERDNPLNEIKVEWCPKDLKTSWRISANFPHKTFNIFDEENLYCIGIVFDINDLL